MDYIWVSVPEELEELGETGISPLGPTALVLTLAVALQLFESLAKGGRESRPVG